MRIPSINIVFSRYWKIRTKRGVGGGGTQNGSCVTEQRAALLELMRATLMSKRPFVRMGAELADPALQSISLVSAPYGLQHRNLGTVSLLGPTRMNYVIAIDAVRSAAHELSRFVEEMYEE